MVYKTNKIERIVVLLIFMTSFGIKTEAQTADSTFHFYHPEIALKWNMTAILNYTPSIQFGVEYALENNQSVNLELGFLNDYGAPNQDYIGYRLVGEYRFYKHKKQKKRTRINFYAIQTHFKQTFLSGRSSFSRDNFSYSEILDYRLVNTTQNLLFVIGKVFTLSEKYALELSQGAGVRMLHVKYKDIPSDAIINRSGDDFFNVYKENEGRYFFPHYNFNVKLIYILK